MATKDTYETNFGEDVSNKNTSCPECDGHVRTKTGEVVCKDCGLVIADQQVDHGPEWRSFEDEDSTRKRVGAPLTPARHDLGLSTEIGRRTDARGNQISGRKRQQLGRLRREHRRGRWQSKQEKNLATGLIEVRRLVGQLELGRSIRDQACQLFRTAQDADLLPGRSIESIAAGSVYGTIRCNGLSRTIEEVGAHAQCDLTSLQNAYGVLNTELGLPTPPRGPKAFVSRFASELSVPDTVRRRAEELAKRAERDGLTNGTRPSAVAAACLYKSGQENGQCLTQEVVAETADTTPVTLRNHWRVLNKEY